MLMTVDELKRYIATDEEDQVLGARLSALELLIRAYTNNNFQLRTFRAVADAEGRTIKTASPLPFAPGDTLQITDSDLQENTLVTISTIENGTITVDKELYEETGVVITKVHYPADVKMGAANLLKWEIENREKVGVASESISRHSVTYVAMDAANTAAGYPVALMGFLLPYVKARFGRGVDT